MGRAHPGDGGWPDGPLLDPGGSAPEAGHSDGLERATPSTATPPAQGKNQRTSLGSVITVTRGATHSASGTLASCSSVSFSSLRTSSRLIRVTGLVLPP